MDGSAKCRIAGTCAKCGVCLRCYTHADCARVTVAAQPQPRPTDPHQEDRT